MLTAREFKRKAFTVLEMLMVVATLGILAAIVYIAVNPQRQFAEGRNGQRSNDVNAILNALWHYSLDHNSTLPNGIDENLRMVGTAATGCNVACGAQSTSMLDIPDSPLSYLLTRVSAMAPAKPVQIDETAAPQILHVSVTPAKVLPGDQLTVTVSVVDANGISKVTADMGGIETIPLKLKTGDSFQGEWEAIWSVHDTKSQNYVSIITATNINDKSTTTNVKWSDPPASGWVSPDSFQTPTGQWTNGASAIDGNTITYATNTFGGAGFGEYIVFNYNTPVYTNRLRFDADFLNAQVTAIQIDIFTGGSWVNVVNGGDESTWNAQMVEVPFTAATVSQARFRWNYHAGGYYYWLYEFQLYQTTPTLTLPVVSTRSADLIQDTYATIHGDLTDDGGEPDSYQFQYGLTDTYGTTTTLIAGATTGNALDTFVSGLTPNTIYHFRVVAQNSVGTVYGGDQTFKTLLPILGNIPPNNFSDPDSAWENAINATDQNVATYARSYHGIGSANDWSSYLYFSQGSNFTNGVSFYARGQTEVDQAQVDIEVGGNWSTVFSGSFTGMQFVHVTFSQALVTQTRIRFHAATANTGFYWQLYEINFQKSSEGTSGACVDLSGLAETYIAGIPTDPQIGTPARTYYAVKKITEQRYVVYSCGAELGQSIFVQR